MIHRILETAVSHSMGTHELKLLLQHIKRPKSELLDLQSDTNIVSSAWKFSVFLKRIQRISIVFLITNQLIVFETLESYGFKQSTMDDHGITDDSYSYIRIIHIQSHFAFNFAYLQQHRINLEKQIMMVMKVPTNANNANIRKSRL